MKKFIFTISFLFAFYNFGQAQNFMFERISPEIIYGDTGGTGTQWGSKSIFKNISQDTIRFAIERTIEQFPDTTWYSAMCTKAGCYAPFVNIVPDPSFEDNSLEPGQQDTLILYFYGQNPGLGTIYLRMYEVGNPSVYIEQVFKAQLGTVGITQISSIVEDYKLEQNYPNPFNPSTKIIFSVPVNEIVTLKVYDILGKEVSRLINAENITAGRYELDFDAAGFSSGIYYYVLKTENFMQTKKMILQK